ncbi:hypothetical protein BDW62DRAFT_184885, partial [Aspergillus aurantiobrunneus]
MIWYLLEPRIDVYVQSEGITFAGVAVEVIDGSQGNAPVISSDDNEQRWWSVHLWHLGADGVRIRLTLKSYTINAYSGLRDVTELPGLHLGCKR